jgi:hypothetical protein
MTNPTDQADVEAVQEKGLDKTGKNADNRPTFKPNPRDAAIEAMLAKVDAAEKRTGPELEAALAEAEAEGVTEIEPIDEVEQLEDEPAPAAPAKKAAPAAQPTELSGDLAKYIIVDKGVPMFRTKVNGKDQLVPLERVQTTIQKHEAADIRLQQASTALRDAEQIREQARHQAALVAQSAAKTPPSSDADDESIQQEAEQLSEVLMGGTKDDIATALTGVLRKVRQPAAVAINQDEIVNKAVAQTKVVLGEDARKVSLATGYKQAKDTYPEVFQDPNLYNFADRISQDIAAENPAFSPAEVIMEAGKRTREWVASLKGEATPTPNPTPSAENRRVVNKQKLRPLPPSRSARSESTPIVQDETPAGLMAEIRRSRGQA